METRTTPDIFADPTVDFAFKRIFGTEQHKAATIGLLNSIITDRHIADVTFMNVELQGLMKDDRKAVVDVFCTGDDGSSFVVEMQNFTHSHFRERMVVYGSSIIVHLAEKDRHWNYDLRPVYVIAILNEKLSYPSGEPHSYHSIYSTVDQRSGRLLPSAPQYHFFELGRFAKTLSELDDDVDKWLYLLKESKFFTDVPSVFSDVEAYDSYFSASRTARFTKEERMQYDKDMMTQTDLDYIKRDAKEEGAAAKALEMAKAMKADGIPQKMICKYTGLTPEEVDKL